MGNKDEWRLEELEIKFNRYGKNKGKYAGIIKFQNCRYESFTFNVNPDVADAYIKLISADIANAADNLGSRLIESLGLIDNDNKEEAEK